MASHQSKLLSPNQNKKIGFWVKAKDHMNQHFLKGMTIKYVDNLD